MNKNKIYYDEFRDAIVSETGKQVIYNYDKCIEILITNQGMSEDEALDYLDYNHDNMKDNFPILI